MDPNSTLSRLREALDQYGRDSAAAQLAAEGDSNDAEIEALQAALNTADEVRDAIEALDGWLSKGGFLPAAWAARETKG